MFIPRWFHHIGLEVACSCKETAPLVLYGAGWSLKLQHVVRPRGPCRARCILVGYGGFRWICRICSCECVFAFSE
ncbi:unnamed protein product [Urochloa humidicola]